MREFVIVLGGVRRGGGGDRLGVDIHWEENKAEYKTKLLHTKQK